MRRAFSDDRIFLFIHGQPDSAFFGHSISEIRKFSPDKIFVTTPDLLKFPQSVLFPYLPVDVEECFLSSLPVAKTKPAIFSRWKGDYFAHVFDECQQKYNGRPLLQFALKKRLDVIKTVKPTLVRSGKLISLYRSPENVDRRFVGNRLAFLTELAMTECIVDSDFLDFPNGGNFSVTGLQALYLNSFVFANISQINRDLISDTTGLDFSSYPSATCLSDIRGLVESYYNSGLPSWKSPFQGIDVKDVATECWHRIAPEFFGD